MNERYKIIHLEDIPSDAEFVARALKKGNIDFEHLVIDTEREYRDALDTFFPDIILCDHSLPSFNSFEAVKLLRSKHISVPFILITGQMSEEVALRVVEEGADDYILKDRLTRLPNAVVNAIEKHRYEKERKVLISQAQVNSNMTNRVLTNLSDRLLLALKAASIGTWEYDLHHDKFVADVNMDAIYGSIPASFDGLIKFVHKDDHIRVSKELNEALLEHAEFDSEFRIVRPDKCIRYIKGITIVQRDSAGFPAKIIGINQDVTADKEAQRAVKESEARYRSFFENSMDAILLIDANGQTYAANEAACAIFRCTEQDICNKGKSGIIDVNDERSHDLIRERNRTGQAKGEITFIRSNGDKFPGEVTTALFTDAYGQERISMIIRDISDRKLVEEKLRSTTKSLDDALNDLQKIMDSSPDVICTFDASYRFVNVSAAAQSVWGYTAQELIGQPYIDFVCAADHKKTIEAANKIVSGTPVTVFKNRYVHKNGNLIPVLWSARWDAGEQLMFCIAKDASDKKPLKKDVEYERERFFELFYHVPTAVAVLYGPNHTFEMANPLYLELVGKTDIIGKDVIEALPEVAEQGFIELLDTVYKTGATFHAKEMHARLHRKGSSALVDTYLNFIYKAKKDSDGEVEGIFVFVIDVTEQVETRKKIEESNERFEIVSKVTNDAIWDWNLTTNELYWNSSYERLFGYPMLQKNGVTRQLTEAVHSEDKERVNRGLDAAIQNKVKQWQDEYRYIKADGQIAYVYDRGYLIYDEHNNPVRFVGAMQDITERKLWEEKLHEYQEQLLESQTIARIGSFQLKLTEVKNIMFSPLSCSQETYKIFNLPFACESLSLWKLLRMVHADDRMLVKEMLQNTFTQKLPYAVDFRIIGKDCQERWVHFQAKVIWDTATNAPVKMFGTIKDITTKKEQELNIKKSAEEREILIAELTRSLYDLKQFAFITSHNFRAPLSNLIGLLSLIDDEYFTDKNREVLQMFKSSTLQLNNTINDLTQILIIKNNVNVTSSTIEMDQLLSATIELFSGELLETGCLIKRDWLVENVVFNKTYLESVLINLLSNAIKYRSPNRRLVIKLSTYLNIDGDTVLSIADNGLGIDLNMHRSKVFGLYQRFHNGAEGAGLGLFMVKSQLNAAGATIAVDSEVNTGTTFYITFRPKQKNLLPQ